MNMTDNVSASVIAWLQNPIHVHWGRNQRAEIGREFTLPEIRPLGILVFLPPQQNTPRHLSSFLEESGISVPSGVSLSSATPFYQSDVTEEIFFIYVLSGSEGWPSIRNISTNKQAIADNLNRFSTWYCPLDPFNPNADDVRSAIEILEDVPNAIISSGMPDDDPYSFLDYLQKEEDAIDPVAIALAELDRRNNFLQAQPTASDRPRGDDQLNISPVAKAFAWTMALNDTKTPLCIGIFGPWGSGKSFLMELIQEELIDRKERASTELLKEFVKDIRIVSFNAWTYAKGDLWSAMLFELLSQLRDHKDLPWKKRVEKLNEARLKLAKKRREMETARLKMEHEQRKAERIRNEKLQEIEHIDAKIEITQKETERRIDLSRIDHENLVAAAEQQGFEFTAYSLRTLTSAIRALFPFLSLSSDEETESGFKRWIPFLLAVLIFSGVMFIVIDPFHWMEAFWKWLTSIIGTIAGFWSFLSRGFKKLRDGDAELNKKLQQARQSIDKVQSSWQEIKADFGAQNQQQIDALLKQREDLQEDLGKVDSEVDSAENDLNELQDEVSRAEVAMEEAQRQYGQPIAKRCLEEFVASRLAEGDYAQRLGNLQRVEEDLAELANILGAPAPEDELAQAPERIILFIDDLDRCPPDKVVDVLEAIQLLLAENRNFGEGRHPFIVVLGADTRILTRALETHYPGILDPDDAPDGLDYLEKIIQIPYRVPPVDKAGYALYISKLAGIELITTATGGNGQKIDKQDTATEQDGDLQPVPELKPLSIDLEPSFKLITAEDLEHLESFQSLSATYPRAIKRLVNQYRLCKLMSFGHGEFAKREYAFMLAIASGFRLSTRRLVVRLEASTAISNETIISIFEQIRTEHLRKLEQAQAVFQKSGQRQKNPKTAVKATETNLDKLRPDPLLKELELLLPRLQLVNQVLPAPAQVRRVLRSVLPYCFLGDFENVTARTA
jgi:hypothetical protein